MEKEDCFSSKTQCRLFLSGWLLNYLWGEKILSLNYIENNFESRNLEFSSSKQLEKLEEL